MAARTISNVVLLIDDEPEYLGWVIEYIESLGLRSEVAVNLKEALANLERKGYRLVLLDLNIPAAGVAPTLARTPVAQKYPGIVVAQFCRNRSYDGGQVVAYSVHDDDAADAELTKLGCRYLLKGRPAELKRLIKEATKIPARTGQGKSR